MYSRVWRRFTGKKELQDNSLIRYRIQDITQDVQDQVVEFLLKCFITESPIPKLTSMSNEKQAVEFLRKFWKDTMDEKMSQIAVIDNENCELRGKIVGVSLMHHAVKGEPTFQIPIDKGTSVKVWFGFVAHIYNKFDTFEHYDVNEYIEGRGLAVDPSFRGEGIGLELLKGRIDIGKALGVKLSATIFTNISSQKLAAKAGYHTAVEIIYEDYRVGGKAILSGIETKSGKLMAIEI